MDSKFSNEEMHIDFSFLENYTFSNDTLKAILGVIKRKDVYHIFLNPVTDQVAPDYSKIIKTAMDFSAIENKINSLKYHNLVEFKNDFDLIWKNAHTYNDPRTIYHKEATRLSFYSDKIFSQKNIEKILGRIDKYQRTNKQTAPKGRKSVVLEHDSESYKIYESVRNAAINARMNLNSIPSIPSFCSVQYHGPESVTLKHFHPETMTYNILTYYNKDSSTCRPQKKQFKMVSKSSKKSTTREKILSQLSFNHNELEFTPIECSKLVSNYGSVIGAVFAMSLSRFVLSAPESLKHAVSVQLNSAMDQKHIKFLKELRWYEHTKSDLLWILSEIFKKEHIIQANILKCLLQDYRNKLKKELLMASEKTIQIFEKNYIDKDDVTKKEEIENVKNIIESITSLIPL